MIATGYATSHTSSHSQKKFSTTPILTNVVARVMLADIKKPITKAKMMLAILIMI
jgi:hypothetical protein